MAFTLILILFLYLVVGYFLKIYHIDTPDLPDGAWALLSVFAGSYTLSRGVEKFSANWNYSKSNGIDSGNVTPDDDFDDVNEMS